MRADGLVTSFGELLADPPADDENAALVYLEAFELAEAEDASRQFIKLWHDPETADDARAMLPALRLAIDAFQRAAELPRSRYPIDYEAGLDVAIPHLFKLRWSQLLLAEAVAEAESGDIDLALGRMRSYFACCRSLREELTWGSQFVRISMISSGLDVMKRILPRCDSAQAAIDAVQIDDARGAIETAMRGELVLMLRWRDAQMRSRLFEGDRVGLPGALDDWLLDKDYSLGHPAIQGLLQPFFDSELALSMGYGSRFVESCRLPFPERLEEVEALEREFETEGRTLAGFLVMPVFRTLEREARLASSIQRTRLAAALLDLRRERGVLPEDWSAQIDSRLLIDPRTAEAFPWKRTEDSLILRFDEVEEVSLDEDEDSRDWEISLRG